MYWHCKNMLSFQKQKKIFWTQFWLIRMSLSHIAQYNNDVTFYTVYPFSLGIRTWNSKPGFVQCELPCSNHRLNKRNPSINLSPFRRDETMTTKPAPSLGPAVFTELSVLRTQLLSANQWPSISCGSIAQSPAVSSWIGWGEGLFGAHTGRSDVCPRIMSLALARHVIC